MGKSPAVVAWFVKASVFHSVNSAPSANGGSNPIWECCIDRLNLKEFVAIQIARCRVLFEGFTIQASSKEMGFFVIAVLSRWNLGLKKPISLLLGPRCKLLIGGKKTCC